MIIIQLIVLKKHQTTELQFKSLNEFGITLKLIESLIVSALAGIGILFTNVMSLIMQPLLATHEYRLRIILPSLRNIIKSNIAW